MNVTSLPTEAAPERCLVTLEFMADDTAHPSQLLFALAGVTQAMDQLEARQDSQSDFNLLGNLSVAANILARQLVHRLA